MDTSFHDTNDKSHGNTLKTKFIRTPTCGTLVGETVRGSFIGTRVGKSAELGMLICPQETRIFLVGILGRHQNGRGEAEYGSHVEEVDEKTLILPN